jgi:hypothetical protein
MGSPAPANQFVGAVQFPKNKKNKKLENSKIKRKTIPNRPPPQTPLLSRYNFFDKYAQLHKLGFEPLISRLACTLLSTTLHVTYVSMRYAILLY